MEDQRSLSSQTLKTQIFVFWQSTHIQLQKKTNICLRKHSSRNKRKGTDFLLEPAISSISQRTVSWCSTFTSAVWQIQRRPPMVKGNMSYEPHVDIQLILDPSLYSLIMHEVCKVECLVKVPTWEKGPDCLCLRTLWHFERPFEK